MKTIASVVEGHGEEAALPILVRRIIAEGATSSAPFLVSRPHRVPRGRMVKQEHLSRAVELQARRVREAGGGGVLVLLDADDDPPVELAQQVRSAAQSSTVEVVVAVRECEAWFLAAVQSLRSHRSVRDDARWSGDPEQVRGAKEALGEQMLQPYRETLHQAAFSQVMDLSAAADGCESFARFTAAVRRLGR